MFKRKQKKTGCETPKFSYTTPPPPPTSGSNAAKPNPNYIPPASVKPKNEPCTYETPCGWCCKWDKKCDKKIPERGLRAKTSIIDETVDFSYGKCLDCKHDGWPATQCEECNPANGFKYFVAKEANND